MVKGSAGIYILGTFIFISAKGFYDYIDYYRR